ncbi:divergent polysaccharide deacetylase family protein [Epibacterium ulvae]|uniref:divergent polysaccharide deacetylase family protein n=1 Tax=Epibacterium ulvae TaxID=1156985 RepID=UPI001BFC56F3|nr:divergent polysaccharide deacetylase family protein [Epibacterium ulvae]MBT8152447.1 divergent polysaccharide deacetylase family protein [Epibacterium ulvae]
MRGFLGGVAIGALVSGLGAALASLAVPLPQTIEVSSEDPLVSDAPEVATPVPAESIAPDADLVEASPAVPDSPVALDDISSIAPGLSTPAAKPVVEDATSTLSDIDFAASSVPDVNQTPDAGNGVPSLSLPAPDAPAGDSAPVIETTSAPLPVDEPEVIVVEETPAEVAVEEAIVVAPAAPKPAQPDLPADLPADLPLEIAADTAPAATETETVQVETPAEPEGEQKTAAPQIALNVPQIEAPQLGDGLPGLTLPQVAAPVVPRDLPSDEGQEDPQAEASEDENRPGVGTPGVQLGTQGSEEGGSAQAPQSDLPAFVRNAEEFIALDDRPLMSIVLIDDAGSVGADALEEFPYPLTFAIRADDPQATAKAQARRAAGFEVLMLVDLPRDAGPREAEAAMEVWTPKLPQALGILEGVDTGFQGNRPLADQVAALSASGGLGLVTQAKGLNTVQKLALRDGIPSGLVFRDFDGAGQDPRAIRRFLDQAAFRAGQEGAVIMLGRLQPDTISALLLWGLQDRASRVQLAPVSASLRTGLQGG